MSKQSQIHRPLMLVMVGLPARGKTFIAQKLARYLIWLGYTAKVFNVGNYRRQLVGSTLPHSFFSPDNAAGLQARQEMAKAAMADLRGWVHGGGQIAIYDATNTTKQRRNWLKSQANEIGCDLLFVESVSTDASVVESNIRQTKLLSPDYVGVKPQDAVADFRARIAHYERAYEAVDPSSPLVRLEDVGRRVVIQNVTGFLRSRLVFFLMNLHIRPRTIYLTRHGQSRFNVMGRIGGDSSLSPLGERYQKALPTFFEQRQLRDPKLFTSTLQRTIQTAALLPFPKHPLRELDEIDAGNCDSWTYEEIKSRLPKEYEARQQDKLRYRYPRGESYEDLIHRVAPVIIELERQQSDVIVVAHQAVLRCLYAYFVEQPPEKVPHLEMPLHTVIELQPKAYGAKEVRHSLL